MLLLLRIIPKNVLSVIVGHLARLRLPQALNLALIRWFVRRYGVNTSEIKRRLEDFPTLAQFFERELLADARPIANGLVSPVDGRIEQFGSIENGLALQAKGRSYFLAELLGDATLAAQFNKGYFITIYLAPGDYHHIHSPVSGRIVESIHLPGALWPVNQMSVEKIERLFCINERIVSVLDSQWGKVAVVKVGATNVGSICTSYNSFAGNDLRLCGKREVRRESYCQGIAIGAGEKLASFRMGSTVVLLLARNVRYLGPEAAKIVVGQKLRYGQTLVSEEAWV